MGNIRELCYNSVKDNKRPFITTELNKVHRFPNKRENPLVDSLRVYLEIYVALDSIISEFS